MKSNSFKKEEVLALAKKAYDEGNAHFEIDPGKCALFANTHHYLDRPKTYASMPNRYHQLGNGDPSMQVPELKVLRKGFARVLSLFQILTELK